MPTKTEAIKNFLTVFTEADLARLYNQNMEVQVNVAQDNGEQVAEKSGFTGRMWRGYTDGEQTWKSFRIPWKAATEPEYSDSKLTWSLTDHAESIGMTGWDWQNKISRWMGYDFDSIIGHNDGLTAEELQAVTDAAVNIPWITTRKSTSGKGLHFYVFVNVPTENHTEHAALARAILGKMSATAGFDFNSKIDICGGNMWVWHRKMKGTDGLELIKKGCTLKDIPPNWRDHVPVIKGRRKKILPKAIKEESLFEQLTGQYTRVKLDDSHKKLLNYLEKRDASWWYDQDNNLLVCHTFDLKQAFSDLNIRGLFDTIATGKDRPDINCFMCPLEYPRGSWVVRRFSQGVQEASTWFQDNAGWTTCHFNREPTLEIAARVHDAIEDEKGAFHFNEAETATATAETIGAKLNLPDWANKRKATIKKHKDGKRVIVAVKREQSDNLPGWKEERDWWKKIFDAKLPKEETNSQNYDSIVRHLITVDHQDSGWVLNTGNKWQIEPLLHLRIALKSLGSNDIEINNALGKCVLESWKLVNKPFQPEYPGNKEWNRDAVQLRYLPQQSEELFIHKSWDNLFEQCGCGFNEAVKNNGWCLANSITTGADYLRLWVASLFQSPTKHLPYLFFYSPEQQTGKTTFHEALKLLITANGYIDVKAALVNQAGFNEELKGAIICAVDECDLRQNKGAYNRIKDWVTSEDILIHPKGKTPYLVKNISHFVQTGNNPNECPIFTGDSRIVVIRVPPLEPVNLIPKDVFFKSLDKEAPAFLGTLLSIDIPPCSDRLGIPVIESEEKEASIALTRNDFEIFLSECCYYSPGEAVKYTDLWIRFQEFLEPAEMMNWSKIKMGRSLPSKYPKGRLVSEGGQFFVGNLLFTEPQKMGEKKYILKNGNLVK